MGERTHSESACINKESSDEIPVSLWVPVLRVECFRVSLRQPRQPLLGMWSGPPSAGHSVCFNVMWGQEALCDWLKTQNWVQSRGPPTGAALPVSKVCGFLFPKALFWHGSRKE